MKLEGQNHGVYSVSEVNALARNLLEGSFPDVLIQGEVSGFKSYRSGHWYFSLKDEDAELRCVMFRSDNQRLKFTPTDGAQIRLRCRISLYEARGNYQAIARDMQLAGTGELLLALEALRKKLAAEGLFEAENKRPLPQFARHLAVITSPSGAALRDIFKTLRTRSAGFQCTLLPVSVQGANAAPDILQAFRKLAKWPAESGVSRPDLVLLARGGGSLEDLWAFNLEPVVRAVAACQIPVVTGIGHETDTTLSDLAADQRAATPTAAAALTTPDLQQVNAHITDLLRHMARLASRQVQHLKQDRLRQWTERLAAKNPRRIVQQGLQRLDECDQRLARVFMLGQERRSQRLDDACGRLRRADPTARITRLRRDLSDAQLRLDRAETSLRRSASTNLAALETRLEALSPTATLARGYAILTRPGILGERYGQTVTLVNQATLHEPLRAHLADGELEVQVQGIHTPSSPASQ